MLCSLRGQTSLHFHFIFFFTEQVKLNARSYFYERLTQVSRGTRGSSDDIPLDQESGRHS